MSMNRGTFTLENTDDFSDDFEWLNSHLSPARVAQLLEQTLQLASNITIVFKKQTNKQKLYISLYLMTRSLSPLRTGVMVKAPVTKVVSGSWRIEVVWRTIMCVGSLLKIECTRTIISMMDCETWTKKTSSTTGPQDVPRLRSATNSAGTVCQKKFYNNGARIATAILVTRSLGGHPGPDF